MLKFNQPDTEVGTPPKKMTPAEIKTLRRRQLLLEGFLKVWMSRVLEPGQSNVSSQKNPIGPDRRVGFEARTRKSHNNIFLLIAVSAASDSADQLAVLVERNACLAHLKAVAGPNDR